MKKIIVASAIAAAMFISATPATASDNHGNDRGNGHSEHGNGRGNGHDDDRPRPTPTPTPTPTPPVVVEKDTVVNVYPSSNNVMVTVQTPQMPVLRMEFPLLPLTVAEQATNVRVTIKGTRTVKKKKSFSVSFVAVENYTWLPPAAWKNVKIKSVSAVNIPK